MEIGKVVPISDASFYSAQERLKKVEDKQNLLHNWTETALDRLWNELMIADIKANSKKLDKKIFEKPKKMKYKCSVCKDIYKASSICTLKIGLNETPPDQCPYEDYVDEAKWVKCD